MNTEIRKHDGKEEKKKAGIEFSRFAYDETENESEKKEILPCLSVLCVRLPCVFLPFLP